MVIPSVTSAPIFSIPPITPSNSERFTLDSTTLDSDNLSGSFRREIVEDPVLARPIKPFPETSFKTISGASVSANASTLRTAATQTALFATDSQEPAATFESTASFAAIPLQPLPNGSGPLNGFMSGPLERGFASGPLEKGAAAAFMSGPIDKGTFMSGPLDRTDKSNFSAPLTYAPTRPRFGRLVRTVSGPVKAVLTRTFSRQSLGSSGWMHRLLWHPVTHVVGRTKASKFHQEPPSNCYEVDPSQGEYRNTLHNLQWAHGKAGEDRVHVVLSEEQGWLFVGIYDGFSGPDAPDYLLSHLYKAIDKELEGILWDYDDNCAIDATKSEVPETKSDELSSMCRENASDSQQPSGVVSFDAVPEQLHLQAQTDEGPHPEIVEEKDEVSGRNEDVKNVNDPSTNPRGTDTYHTPSENSAGLVRKSKRLYELLQMERSDGQDCSVSEVGLFGKEACDGDAHSSFDSFLSRNTLPEPELMSNSINRADSSSCRINDASTAREDSCAVGMECKQGTATFYSDSAHKRRFFIGSKLRKMYIKQKSLRKKLFPWSFDWHREETHAKEQIAVPLGPVRRCKSGPVDHDAVLRAMTVALDATEKGYMDMVEEMLDVNPELSLMGSCVLVMLMKDQDVYVMNLGDSRVILAQERLNERHLNSKMTKDDLRHRNSSRESLIRMELGRISEESPVHNHSSGVNNTNKDREISICGSRTRAAQLSTDHSTDVEEMTSLLLEFSKDWKVFTSINNGRLDSESNKSMFFQSAREVLRIKAEHPDDNQAILNDRVKGQLKVTRAFGAAFLKKPRCNEALLEMFRVDYLGTAAYLSCIPAVVHHRLCSSDRFLVLSSDGLYQYFSNEEVVSHVAWFIESVPEGDPAQYLIAELLFRAAKKNGMSFHELLDIPHGDRRKYHDDVSVMVISLEGRIWKSSG
ncbi:hypothetical protein Syun_028572 [Stephania yunnanensis]|uniref:PPM-type phosphatase domain-containing protein n=1 Tax=Stephania yunnanensis TaxID=152371 RepID=A0AAP0E709_9MAGN